MGTYMITGRQGSGKTTVIKLLQQRGFTAYNTDDLPDVTKLQNTTTGEVIAWPDGPVDWATYAWNWQKPQLLQLLAGDTTVFIGGVVSNQKDFYDLFDTVFVITVSENTLRARLEAHEHTSHHVPGVIDRILAGHDQKQADLMGKNTVAISGEAKPNEIADEILRLIGKM